MNRLAEILDALNSYHGVNVWQEIILRLDEYDEALTDKVDDGEGDIFALADGTVIIYEYRGKFWYPVHGRFWEEQGENNSS